MKLSKVYFGLSRVSVINNDDSYSELMKKNQLYSISKLTAEINKPKELPFSIATIVEYSEKYFSDAMTDSAKMADL